MYRILITDVLDVAGFERLSTFADVAVEVKTNLDQEALLASLPGIDALIVRSGTRVDSDLIAAAPDLRVIGRAGIGIDNIDVHAATMKGIVVLNTPQANSIALAEHTLGLMLALSRHTATAHASLLAGEWHRTQLLGMELYHKVLGIVGFGHVARLVAHRAAAFAMEVIAYDPFVSEEVARELGATLVDLDDLLTQADFISLHTAATPDTENLINADTISQMKDGARLINVARGSLVDDAALLRALDSGKIAGAALDVFSQEPPTGNPLIGHPRVLHVPHLGANTIEAQRGVATQIVEQVVDALRGDDFRNAVNMPFDAGPDFAATRPYMDLGEKMGILQRSLAGGKIRRVEVEVQGDALDGLIRPVAAALLKGVLQQSLPGVVNDINAPIIAEEQGIAVAQATGIGGSGSYPNLISCRVHWDGGSRVVAGVLFGGVKPRIVQVDSYQLDANPEGVVLVMQNRDVPGVIGQVGTILAAYGVNIGEWRMGRETPGSEALSFINLDSTVPEPVIEALSKIPAVTNLKLVVL